MLPSAFMGGEPPFRGHTVFGRRVCPVPSEGVDFTLAAPTGINGFLAYKYVEEMPESIFPYFGLSQ